MFSLFGGKKKSLFEIINDRDMPALKKALKRKPNLEEIDQNGNTPLLALLKVGNVTNFLQVKEAIKNSGNDDELTYNMAVQLLIAGANIDARNQKSQMTGLHWLASNSRMVDQVHFHLFFHPPFDINAVDKYGKTPLFYAVRNNDPFLIHLLKEKGAQTDPATVELLNKQKEHEELLAGIDTQDDLRPTEDYDSLEDFDYGDLYEKSFQKIYLALQKVNYDLTKINLNEDQLAVYTFNQMDSEINNGGFDQYFFNSSGNDALYALEGLKKIGLTHIHDLLEHALDQFPVQYSSNRQQRWKDMELIDDETKKKWGELDTQYYNFGALLHEDLGKFILEHKQSFFK